MKYRVPCVVGKVRIALGIVDAAEQKLEIFFLDGLEVGGWILDLGAARALALLGEKVETHADFAEFLVPALGGC